MTVETVPALSDRLDLGGTTRHLVHRPRSWDRFALDAPSILEEQFLLTGDMPCAHPLFNDGGERFHDFQVVTDAIQEIGELVGHRYFGVPEDRPGLFYEFGLEITDLTAWRRTEGPGQITLDLRAQPTRVVDGVPRGLDLRGTVSLDGLVCATGRAGLIFLTAALHRNHREQSRRVSLAAGAGQRDQGRETVPVPPSEVGRTDPANVLVGEPAPSTYGRLTAPVRTVPGHPVFWLEQRDHVSGLLLVEALRQTSLLAAARAHGLVPLRSAITGIDLHSRGYTEPDLPLDCAAVPGALGRDAAGRPSVPVTLTMTQVGRTVLEATTSVVQDY